MSDLQCYYDNYATQSSRWADHDQGVCACHGNGWFYSEVDTYHKCPYHYIGQPTVDEEDESVTHTLVDGGGFPVKFEVYREVVLVSDVEISRWMKIADARKHYKLLLDAGYRVMVSE